MYSDSRNCENLIPGGNFLFINLHDLIGVTLGCVYNNHKKYGSIIEASYHALFVAVYWLQDASANIRFLSQRPPTYRMSCQRPPP